MHGTMTEKGSETIKRIEITFQILKVRTVKTLKQEWIEIDVLITNADGGTRQTVVRVGDVLRAEFDVKEER